MMNTSNFPQEPNNLSLFSSSQHILIVDDNRANLKLLSKILNSHGMETTIATSGSVALKQVELAPPELILLDIMMPEMDGFEVCRRLKLNPLTSDIPIIFITALSSEDDKVKGLSIGGVDYITKPFKTEEVIARVKVHLQLRALTQSLAEKNQKLEETIQQLNVAHQKLVVQEKLATIGSMMSGISHELRNPLNFINNYSKNSIEMNDELLEELTQYFPKINPDSVEYIQEIINDLQQNSVTIYNNGKRAESVIKSILEQVQANDASAQEVNLNQLIDQVLKLVHESHKVAPNNLPVLKTTEYDKNLATIHGIPISLTRAFINLFDNAYYALQKKQEQIAHLEESFTPKLNVKTYDQGDMIEVRVLDNGVGIPENVQDKIFEPFFTTKPGGEGTGLGLSLTRDIIVGQHGGTLEFNTEIGQYTEFVIKLPRRQLLSSN